MADIAINWDAGASANPHGPLGVVESAYSGAEKGYELGQKAAVRSALQGVDLNDPASLDTAMGGLVRAGAGDQATALQGLGISRQLNKIVMPQLVKRMQESSAAPDEPQGGGSPLFGGNPNVESHYGDTMGQATKAVESLAALPLAERPAAAAQIRQQFIDRGVPAAAIDDHMTDLSDAGLAATAKFFGDHAAWMQSPDGHAAGAPAPTHPTGWGWANSAMNDQLLNDPVVSGFLKAHGIDTGPTMERAERLIAPWNTEAASAAYAGQKREAEKAVDLAFSVPEAIIAAKKAGMVASAEVAAKSPSEFVTVKGADGQEAYIRKDYAMGYAAAHGGVLGQGIAPAEQKFRTDQATQAAEILKPDPAARNAAADSQASSERALSIISHMKFDQATPVKAQIAAALRTAGFKDADKYANDVAGYQQATTQALVQGAKSAFPSRVTDRDIKLMHDIYPTLKTPNDAAAVAMGTQAAQALRTQQWEDFKANYTGAHDSPGDIQKAWLAGPGGQSVLQSPLWANVNIGGRAAFNPKTDVKTVNGVKWGAWGLGTGHPVYFAVH